MNKNEIRVKKTLEHRGYKVLRSGWPDFFVIDKSGKGAFLVELKCKNDQLSKEQKAIHYYLFKCGIRTYVIRDNVRDNWMPSMITPFVTEDQKKMQGLNFDFARREIENDCKALLDKIDQLKSEIKEYESLIELSSGITENENSFSLSMQEMVDISHGVKYP